MAVASLRNFSMTYNQGEKALNDINLDIEKSEFLVICGRSGSGKSTLLLNLKKEVAPAGRTSGALDIKVAEIGIVFQNCENQLVTSTVINDLTFEMENIGLGNAEMKKRMAETVSFFGIEGLLHKSPDKLSGGQKQLVALCAAMMTQPKLLLLDEPLSQLDPIAAKEFLDMLKRINDELGITVVMTEHRLDEVLSFAHRVVLLDEGRISFCGEPQSVLKDIWKSKDKKYIDFIPSLAKASLAVSSGEVAALTTRRFQSQFRINKRLDVNAEQKRFNEIAAQAKNVVFKYPISTEYVLKKLDLTLYKGELVCLMGGNGSGKSTLLKAMAGILKPYMGKIKRKCTKIGYMPQNLSAFFLNDTVADELCKADEKYYNELICELKLEKVLNKHPYDISGGEQQRAALASILLKKTDFILLDEPTKAMDPYFKSVVARLLKNCDAAVIASTHDLEFAASHADRCMMLFDGDIAFEGAPREFFSHNRYYTTEIAKAVGSGAITFEDVIMLWEKEEQE